jgi:hypothetical protein
MAYQRLGKEVYRDPEPQSHRAQYPWLLAHQRENLDNIKELLATVVDPQVEELRSYNLAANEVLDMRTEYYSVEGTGELETCWVDGKVVSWERKRVVLVTREEGRTGHLGAVPVRRTARARGDMAGRGGDQARLEDLGKPVLIVCQPCGHLQSIAVDLNMSGLDTKMIRLMNQRTGSYCYLCTATMQEAHDVTRVRRGFQADLSMEQLLKLAAELMETAGVPKDKWSEHVLLAEKGDASIRFGIKRFPLSTVVDSTRPYAVLHTTLLRAYAFCETLIIRYVQYISYSNVQLQYFVRCRWSSKCHFWGAGRIPPAAKSRMEAATEEWKGDFLGSLLGFRHTKAPNQVTGYLCRLFFAENNRESVVEAVSKMSDWRRTYRREMEENEKAVLGELIQRMSVIGRVIASDSLIKVNSTHLCCICMDRSNSFKAVTECGMSGVRLPRLLPRHLRFHPGDVALGAGLRDHPPHARTLG